MPTGMTSWEIELDGDSCDSELDDLIESSMPLAESTPRRRHSWKLMFLLVGLSLPACRWVVPVIAPNQISKQERVIELAVEGSSVYNKKRNNVTILSSFVNTQGYIMKQHDNRLGFDCPAFVVPPANADANQKLWYDSKSSEIANNATEFLKIFQNVEEYDNWGHSYGEVKHGMSRFKKKYFVPNLASGMSIYESACGIGLNLFMTLEILKKKNVEGITVYGNDYVGDSVRVANQLLASGSLPGNSGFGLICQADSTNLQHIPDNSFDLVFTGYISPMLDPLEWGGDEPFTKYTQLCEATEESDPEKFSLNIEAQRRQDTWYRSWVEEMIRIAKPGAPVIVEQVSYPQCEAVYDWGGVHPSFWERNIEDHGWDIDPESIKYMDDTIFRHRYHVFMRKNNR
jgi:SAM-dependent methyltransferase